MRDAIVPGLSRDYGVHADGKRRRRVLEATNDVLTRQARGVRQAAGRL
ncbi:MAG TPA: hypothetical protein VFK76_02500 [Gaiellaceae bacterium]|nr:hypothetical protein [Gaiellaceae bacterium]